MLTEQEMKNLKKWKMMIDKACKNLDLFFLKFRLENQSKLTTSDALLILEWSIIFIRKTIYVLNMSGRSKVENRLSESSKSRHDFSGKPDQILSELYDGIYYAENTLKPYLNTAISMLSNRKYEYGSMVLSVSNKRISYNNMGNDLNRQKLKILVEDIIKRNRRNLKLDRAFEEFKHLSRRMRKLDDDVLMSCQKYAEERFHRIKKMHKTIKIWFDLVDSVKNVAGANFNDILERANAAQDKMDNVKYSMVNNIIGLMTAPYFINNFIGPLEGVAVDFSVIFNEFNEESIEENKIYNPNSEYSHKKWMFGIFGFLSDGDAKETAIERIKKMEKESPEDCLKLLKTYSEHKINGIAKSLGNMFNLDSEMWGGLSAKEIIRAQRIKRFNAWKEDSTSGSWGEALKTRFNFVFLDMEVYLKDEMRAKIKEMFDIVESQYLIHKNFEYINRLVELLSFDDSIGGIESVQVARRDSLIKELAKKIELQMLCQYLAIYEPYCGGFEDPSAEQLQAVLAKKYNPYQNRKFGLHPSTGARLILREIFRRLPDSERPPSFIIHTHYQAYLKSNFSNQPGAHQIIRQNVLKKLLSYYIEMDILDVLKKDIIQFSSLYHIQLEKSNGLEPSQKWVSEKQLHEQINQMIFPWIVEGHVQKRVDAKTVSLTRKLMFYKELIADGGKKERIPKMSA